MPVASAVNALPVLHFKGAAGYYSQRRNKITGPVNIASYKYAGRLQTIVSGYHTSTTYAG